MGGKHETLIKKDSLVPGGLGQQPLKVGVNKYSSNALNCSAAWFRNRIQTIDW